MSTTSGYTGQTPPGFCGTIENEQWLGFIANGTTATFTATATNCISGNGIQIALYTSCSSSPIACYGGCTGCAGTPATITVTNMTPGVNYFLLIDGFAGDQCDFTISVTPPSAVQAPNVGPTGAIQGPATICPGGTANFQIPVVTGAGAYIWTGPPGTLINGMPSPATIPAPGGNVVSITFPNNAGTGQICVQPANSCNTGNQVCMNVNLVPIPPTQLPPVTICNEDSPYTTPWGQQINTTGSYQSTLTSYQGCDSIVKQTVTVKPPIIKNLPPKTVCAGTCVTICGVDYCDGGNYSHMCTSWQGCDSLVIFSILVMDPIAEILGGGTLSCSNLSILLNSSPTNSGTKVWKNPAGQVLGTGNTLSVGQPGTYILTVTASAGGVLCTAADTIVVDGNTTPPTVVPMGGILGCGNAMATIGATTNGTNPSFSWSGPGGFTSTLQNPTVAMQGNYIVTVTDASNGCTSTATATVTGNTTPPTATATGATLDCNNPTVTINAMSSAPNSSYSWSGPGGFTAMIANPSVGNVGTYTVTITDPSNNCTSTTTALVDINNVPPGATAAGGLIGCANPMINLSGATGANNPTYAWTGPNGFSSTQQNPSIDTSGTYILTVTGTNGCTSTATAVVNGNVNAPGAAANGGLIDCNGPDIAISGSSDSTTVSWSWTGPGGFASTLQNPNVNTAGNYVLTVTGANNCTSTATAVVNGDFGLPDATAMGGVISCAANSTTISGNSITPGATYSWEGPGNFMSTQQNPMVSNTGVYTLTVTGPNGCTNTATAQVTPDVGVPNASASGGTLNCSITTVMLNGGSVTPGALLVWSGPNNFMSTLEDPDVTEPGVYTLTVTDPSNGCTAQANATVNLNNTAPNLSATGTTLTCTDPSLTVGASSSTNGVTYSWVGPGGFTLHPTKPDSDRWRDIYRNGHRP
ncbi:MAG: hypothetical protein IPL65_04365 [Lewinellaceae bacterium]|nr:hypothetical protein [Lewinellaceae bacterium]